MPLTNVEKQRAFQERKRQRRAGLKALTKAAARKIKREGLDVNVTVKVTDYGTVKINWDISPESYLVLERYCELKGHTVDDLLQDLQVETLARAVKEAKAKRVK